MPDEPQGLDGPGPQAFAGGWGNVWRGLLQPNIRPDRPLTPGGPFETEPGADGPKALQTAGGPPLGLTPADIGLIEDLRAFLLAGLPDTLGGDKAGDLGLLLPPCRFRHGLDGQSRGSGVSQTHPQSQGLGTWGMHDPTLGEQVAELGASHHGMSLGRAPLHIRAVERGKEFAGRGLFQATVVQKLVDLLVPCGGNALQPSLAPWRGRCRLQANAGAVPPTGAAADATGRQPMAKRDGMPGGVPHLTTPPDIGLIEPPWWGKGVGTGLNLRVAPNDGL